MNVTTILLDEYRELAEALYEPNFRPSAICRRGWFVIERKGGKPQTMRRTDFIRVLQNMRYRMCDLQDRQHKESRERQEASHWAARGVVTGNVRHFIDHSRA